MSAPETERGIALLMVLWVLTMLMVIVFSFSYSARTESLAVLSFRQGVEKKFLAESGLERAIMELFYLNANKDKAVVTEGMEVWKTDGRPYTVETNTGRFTVSITEESGKVDINNTPEVILRNLLQNLGHQPEDIDTIADSILDWKDADDLHRLHGAENDYYSSLPRPYRAKDANFETLEELLLVKGVTPEILYGSEEKKGLIGFLTVHSKTGKINLNAAPKEVLLSIPGMSSHLADYLLESRQTADMRDPQGVLGQSYTVMAPYIDLAGSGAFTIEAEGHTGTGKTGYGIKAVVKIHTDNKYTFDYFKGPVAINHVRDNSL